MALSESDRRVNERSSALYTATLNDEKGDPVTVSALATLTVTLYDKATGDIINSRNGQDALNANDVTLHATSGALTWKMKAADNPINTPATIEAGDYERHIALFEWTYDMSGSGVGDGKHEVIIDVLSLTKVP